MNDMSNEFAVDAAELQAEINELKELAKSSSEKSSDLGARKTAISERKGYHKAALNSVLKIDTMSETNRADFLRTFQPMFAAMMPAWGEAMEDLFPEDESDNVEPFDPEAAA